jgi:pilus assembly protein Flp/PilA
MTNIFSRFLKDESGATAIEYGLIAGIISVGIISTLGPLRDALNGVFGQITEDLPASGS